MKGLLKKDLIFLSEQVVMIVIMAVVAIGTMIAVSTNNSTFSMGFVNGYFVVIASIITTSTISYDQSDNGMLYLMTLPISRKMYVNSKYMGTLIVALVTGIILMIINLISGQIVGEPLSFGNVILIFSAAVASSNFINSIGIPAFLKFEGRKGSLAMVITICLIGLICFGFIKTLEKLGYDLEYMINTLNSAGTSAVSTLTIVVSLICLVISYGISSKIINAKEF